MNSHQPRYPVQTVEKALEIIECLKNGPREGLGISHLSESLGLSKNNVHRLLDTLLAYNYVEKDQRSSKYSLSWKLYEIGSVIPRQRNLDNLDTTILQKLCNKHNETVNLAIRVNNKTVIISKVEPLKVSVKASLLIGEHESLHATSLGKVLIAELTEEKLVSIIGNGPYERYTNKTISTLDELLIHLSEVRKRGYALDEEEYSMGLSCVAMPIRNYCDEIIAAISISGPTFRFQFNKIERIIEDLKEALVEYSHYLGSHYKP